MNEYFNMLNCDSETQRLENLRKIKKLLDKKEIKKPEPSIFINNHVHTKYSFSPYSPSAAVFAAYMQSCNTVGIVDHDSFSGADEFKAAGEIIGISTSFGVEIRVDYSKTPIAGRYINNPDQINAAYMLIHGIPLNKSNDVNEFLKPIRQARFIRNELMVNKLNEFLLPVKISIDFEKDVIPLSYYNLGGSITERHICSALAKKIIAMNDNCKELANFLFQKFGIESPNYISCDKNYGTENLHYAVLGLLKSHMIKNFYIPANSKELTDVNEAIDFGNAVNAFPCYSYLGDVINCVTKDKKAQKFEDSFLDLLFETIYALGIRSVTYAPSRNSDAQLKRLKNICRKYDMFEICGEDINTLNQSFICNRLAEAEFQNLLINNKVMIIHEKLAAQNRDFAYYSEYMKTNYPDTAKRKEFYLTKP